MITGDEIRRARQRAGWSQDELAKRVGTTLRTVGNWERGDTSPSQREAILRQALEGFWDSDRTNSVSLASASDVELLGEIARRLGRASSQQEEVGDHGSSAPNTDAAGTAAADELDEVRRRREGWDFEYEALHGDQKAARRPLEGMDPDQLPGSDT